MNQRDSNFEALRIIAILLVLLLHANFFALEGPYPEDIVKNALDSSLRILIQTIGVCSVPIFVLISGWYGIRPSFKGLCNLLFTIGFYVTTIYIIAIAIGHASISVTELKRLLLADSSHWFIKAYICLYILSPALNYFAEHASREELKKLLIGFFIFQTLYGVIFPSATDYIEGGYSPISFIGLYLLSRYVHNYHPAWATHGFHADLLTIIFIIFGVACICCIPSWLGYTNVVYGYLLLTYISPTTITLSVLCVVMTSKLHLKSKIINWLAASCFAVYLVYVSPWVLPPYKFFFQDLYTSYKSFAYWGITFLLILTMYIIIVVVDQIRKQIWLQIFEHTPQKIR